MKLTFWIARCLDDVSVYDIKSKTKKECMEQLKHYPIESYDKPIKVTLEYKDGFDLMQGITGESGLVHSLLRVK